ncbi:hypothetical protein [Streptomyces macrosporus]|uniref:Uncharacterized protein n=1 Tax=Streptomyces macrosporus TaxID=44032 RepID=A0ABP5WSH7_9ACTN
MGESAYVRFQAATGNERGVCPGIFFLVNGLAREGRLTEAQERFRRAANAWYDAAYANPAEVDPTVYDPAVNPGAVAWFKTSARHLIERVDGYLEILDAHGVAYRCLRSSDPGRIVYEDEVQVVAVPPRAG